MVWKLLMAIKKFVEKTEKNFDVLYIKETGMIYTENSADDGDLAFVIDFSGNCTFNHTIFRSSAPFIIGTEKNNHLNSVDLGLIELYLPYALLPYYARRYNKCFAISHFAQTLDGRIASKSGSSKWIGNEENLVHAHRMRAMCDAILIGSGTLYRDNPRLNVRLVEGTDPKKVILGKVGHKKDHYIALDDSTIVFEKGTNDSPYIKCKDILDSLYQKSIYSVYIEGGAKTTSSFLKSGTIDQVQIHISTKIIGAGVAAFSFDGISDIDKSIRFTNNRFIKVGEEIMFIGNLK